MNEIKIIDTEITKIEIENQETGNKIKNVFYCKSTKGEDVLCIYWGYCQLKQGDKIQLKGRFNNKNFIVFNFLVYE